MIFDPLWLLFAAPGLILALIAQFWVKSAYARASRIRTSRGMTGEDVARAILRAGGVDDVKVEPTHGFLSDHYHPLQKVLRLSEGNFHGDSVAAAGIAAHEVGHALQHKGAYLPMMLRSALVPVCAVSSNLAQILFLFGLMMAGPFGKGMMWVAVVGFAAAFLFTLVTLPVEFDASRRAVAVLRSHGLVSEVELREIKHVLTAAALTYLAAAIQALGMLLYALTRARERD